MLLLAVLLTGIVLGSSLLGASTFGSCYNTCMYRGDGWLIVARVTKKATDASVTLPFSPSSPPPPPPRFLSPLLCCCLHACRYRTFAGACYRALCLDLLLLFVTTLLLLTATLPSLPVHPHAAAAAFFGSCLACCFFCDIAAAAAGSCSVLIRCAWLPAGTAALLVPAAVRCALTCC